jgi:hypothetical protein
MNAPLEMTREQAFPNVDVNLIPLPDGHMGEFFGALAAAQGAFEAITKNQSAFIKGREGKASYSFKYADLSEILDKTKVARAANNLALTQLVTNKASDKGGVMIRTILGHSSGARIEATLDVPRGREGEVKDFGGYITYLRRYVVGPMLGVSADDDLDSHPDDDTPPDGSTMSYSQEHASGPRNPAPGSAAESPLLRDAKSVRELTTAFNKFSPENKDRYRSHYERLLEELDTPAAAATAATGTGKAAAPAAAAKPKDDL